MAEAISGEILDTVYTVELLRFMDGLESHFKIPFFPISKVWGRENKVNNLDSIFSQFGHLIGNEAIICNMLQKYSELPGDKYGKIELGHVVPYAEEIVEIAKNWDDVSRFIYEFSKLNIEKPNSYENSSHLLLEHAHGILKLKDYVLDVKDYLKKIYGDKEMNLFSDNSPFKFADNAVLIFNNKEKVQSLNDLLEKKGYDTLFDEVLFLRGDDIVRVADKYNTIKKEVKKAKTEEDDLKPSSYGIINEYSRK